jgi:hypothetical protein
VTGGGRPNPEWRSQGLGRLLTPTSGHLNHSRAVLGLDARTNSARLGLRIATWFNEMANKAHEVRRFAAIVLPHWELSDIWRDAFSRCC